MDTNKSHGMKARQLILFDRPGSGRPRPGRSGPGRSQPGRPVHRRPQHSLPGKPLSGRSWHCIPSGFIALFVVLFLALSALPTLSPLHAQPCPQFPATCPDLRDDPGSADDSVSRLNNPVLPCEIAMENRLRHWAGALVNDIARKEGWDVAEIYEALSSGYRDDDYSVLVYDKRPAHWSRMVWQFVVDRDSLRAWRRWLEDFGQRRLDQTHQYTARLNDRQGAIQAYMDSAGYWGGQMSKYMNDHIAQYQKDLVAGNKAGISAYEKGMAVYRNKQNNFINKAADLQKDPQAGKDNTNADAESNANSLRFSDASTVIIEFDFNGDLAETGGSKRVAPSGSSPAVRWYSIPEPDLLNNVNYYTHSHNMALWMIGGWNPQANQFGGYAASWAADRTNRKGVTIKKIKCDKLQNFYVRVSGNAAAMRRILADLPAVDMEKMVTRQ